MAHIVVLEGNSDLRRAFSSALHRDGHSVVETSSMQEFAIHAAQADIAMIDADLPGGEGYLAARHLQNVRPQAGVMLVSECRGADEHIHGLRQFADQFLTKPIAPELLAAHIAPLVRRFGCATWRLDPVKRELQSPGGHRESLNHQEMRLMELLAARPRASTVSRRDVVTALGHNWLDYDERRLDQMVSRLRRRWLNNSGAELPLHTERGNGYRISVQLGQA